MKTDFTKADVSAKDIAMLRYAVKLTTDQCNMEKSDIAKLRKAGFEDVDILDIVQVVSYYNYVNRLACGLGVELEDYWDHGHRYVRFPFTIEGF